MRLGLLVGAALLVLAGGAPAQEAAPLVIVDGGAVRGSAADQALIFRGIPFAAPPLDDLRWQPPHPVVAWTGERDGTAPAPPCLQNTEGWNRDDYLRGNEDCLTLDVRTPSLAGKLPVMVWIHGGSNRAGSGGGPADSNITDQGVVAVSIQYRLGLLGFFSHPDLAAEQNGSSGNYGLMDQIAGLKWVHDNIAQFGGDPANVTIFGESAGSQDVSLLLAAPAAQGLFAKAILQSGTPCFGMPFRPLAEALTMGRALESKAGGGGITAMRALSPVALFDLQREYGDAPSRGALFPFLRITIDGKVLPDAPDRLLAKQMPKPVIIGTDKAEFGPASDDLDLEEFAGYWYGANGPKALAAYRAENADPRRGNLALRLESDAQFHCPADRLANLLARIGWPVWRYEFDVGPDGGLTRHAYEIAYVLDRKPVGDGILMQDYWAALAITGDPNGTTATGTKRPTWQRWKIAQARQMAFGETYSGMEPGAPRAAFCRYTDAF